jgi:hypothetical protein
MNARVRSLLLPLVGLAVSCTSEGFAQFTEDFAATFGSVVPAPASDGSAPTATLHVPDFGHGKGDLVIGPGDPQKVIHIGGLDAQGCFVIAAAEDPEGIEQVCLERNRTKLCHDPGAPNTIAKVIPVPPVCEAVTAQVGEDVTTRRWTLVWIDFAELPPCPRGKVGEHKLFVWASGQNFGGGKSASGKLVLVNP